MAKSKKLKRFFGAICWHPKDAIYDDCFDIWAYDKNHATQLMAGYYNRTLYDSSFDGIIRYRLFNTIWCRIKKKVPVSPTINHI